MKKLVKIGKKKHTKEREKRIDDIVEQWNDTHGKFIKTDAGKFPASIELHYRIDGSWKGWNKVFGTRPGSLEYEQNLERDMLEDEAFERWSKTARTNG